jgi:2-oxo-3-hexenedioate decarboxylase
MHLAGEAPDPIDHAALARELHEARVDRREVERLTDRWPLSVQDAYRIQDLGIRLREAEGEVVIGGKLGFTSEAMRRAMGVEEPNYGWVTDAMLVDGGVARLGSFIHPKVEPEIAFVLRDDLAADADAAAVLAATDRVVACLEVVDSRYRDFSFRALDNVADDSSAAAFVMGDATSPAALDLASLSAAMSVDDGFFAEATGAAVMGDPAEAVAWMARAAGTRGGRGLRAGDVVLSGGLTAPATLERGMTVTVEIERIGSATMHLEVR